MTVRMGFTKLSRTFGGPNGTLALNDVSIDIAPSTFTAVVGPSGCGKSTLLHIAAGLDDHYEGEFVREPTDSKVGFLFQTPRLLPWASAISNVSFVLESHGTTRRAALDSARRMLDLVGLHKFSDAYPAQLSGGMQQRVALARALAVDPDVLLMDEPFAALDELTAQRMRNELLEIHQANRHTVLFVTHNIYEACYLADRIIVMSAQPGCIRADISVDLPRPRQFGDPELAKLAERVLDQVESQLSEQYLPAT